MPSINTAGVCYREKGEFSERAGNYEKALRRNGRNGGQDAGQLAQSPRKSERERNQGATSATWDVGSDTLVRHRVRSLLWSCIISQRGRKPRARAAARSENKSLPQNLPLQNTYFSRGTRAGETETKVFFFRLLTIELYSYEKAWFNKVRIEDRAEDARDEKLAGNRYARSRLRLNGNDNRATIQGKLAHLLIFTSVVRTLCLAKRRNIPNPLVIKTW